MSNFSDWLKAHNACGEARAFVGNKTLKQAWESCNRPDWMFWLLNELNYSDDQTLRLYACWCAANTPLPDGKRKTWDLMTDNRSRKAVLVAIDYANGEATDQELAAAWDAAEAAAWDAAEAAAMDAAEAAAWADARKAAEAAAWDAAEAAAWYAAEAAAWDAAKAAAWDAAEAAAWADARGTAMDAAEAAARAAQANELRRRIPCATIFKLARKAGIIA